MPAIHHNTTGTARRAGAVSSLFILALLPQAFVLAQQHPEPDVVAQGGLADPPTLEERIVEEREIAEQAATEVLSEEHTGIDAPLDEPDEPETHASAEAPAELVALSAREPERFIGKTLVLDDGVTAVEVGPVLDLRKRVADQEPYVIVDATAYFNSPTEYAVSVRDLDRIEGERLVTPEVEGMHLRGLEYYPEDYVDIRDTSPEEVLARNADADALEEEDEADEASASEDAEPGEIPIKRF
ncbi:MAG: hypothetical protein ACO1PZ_04645 [Gammaproteobacteria bacterium]